MIRVFSLALSFLVLSACATSRENPQLKLISSSEYESVIARNTHGSKVYDGFMNTMDVKGTLVNSSVALAQVDQNARIYQWNPEQYSKEKELVREGLQKETQIFLSFFVPEKKYDDLARPTTKWKIFLDTGGRRVEGKAVKLKSQFAELQSIYPHHTRWQTGYRVSFSIPTSMAEKEMAKLTLTGPLGSAALEFAASTVAPEPLPPQN